MRVLTALSLLLLLSGVPAHAQGYNWSGLYTGVHGGYAWGDASTTDDITDWCTPGDTACIAKFVGPFDFDLEGGFGGGTIGYNIQSGAFVFGPEIDLGYLDLSGSRKTDSSNPTKFQTLDVDGGFYALLGGRAGLAWGGTYLYGKGGWLYWDADVTQTTTNPGYQTNGSGSLNGWAYGGGVEHAIGQGWSLKAEYLHMQFDDADGDQTSISDAPIGHVYENSTELDGDSVKFGLNYKWGRDEYAIPLK
jgi:outer membrane immunogenic protein